MGVRTGIQPQAISVTQEDITGGHREQAWDNPCARALRRELSGAITVLPDVTEIVRLVPERMQNAPSARDFIRAHRDRGPEAVRPGVLTISGERIMSYQPETEERTEMEPETHLVELTQAHIDSGQQKSYEHCPVALALQDHFGQPARVGPYDSRMVGGPNAPVYLHEDSAHQFITAYDNYGRHGVRPGTLTINSGGRMEYRARW